MGRTLFGIPFSGAEVAVTGFQWKQFGLCQLTRGPGSPREWKSFDALVALIISGMVHIKEPLLLIRKSANGLVGP